MTAGGPLVEQHVVAIPSGVVHLRSVAGPAGGIEPPLLLLHQTPLSSRRFEPLLKQLDGWTAAVAPDTPGYGGSTGLAGEASVTDVARTLWAAVDLLVPGPVRVFGRATGTILAVEMSAQRPDRVKHLVLYGLPLYTREEAADRLRGFAPPYVLDADGGHLQWIWQRAQNEYPWAEPELLTEMVADYLAAGPDFATAYRAMWRYDADPALNALQAAGVPTSLIAGGRDRIGFMHERAARRLPWAAQRVLPEATDFVAEQDPIGFAQVLRSLVGADQSSTDEGHDGGRA